MSWDVMVLNGDGTPASLVDVPKDWVPKPLGDAPTVRAAISASLADVDWSDPAWGVHLGDEFSMEFNFQKDGVVHAFSLHIRGGGDPLPTIVGLCSSNGWVAFDYSTGELIDLSNPSRDSWVAFQRFRDKAIDRS
jgi:hypothetical protein